MVLSCFQRHPACCPQDLLEKIGDCSLQLTERILGNSYIVQTSYPSRFLKFTPQPISLCQKIYALCISLFLLPLTILLTLIGGLAHRFSTTHRCMRQELAQQTQAAITIQKLIKGALERRHFLDRSCFPVYRNLCAKINETPLAFYTIPAGRTDHPIFAPDESPFLIMRESGQVLAKERFHNMRKVRNLLLKLRATHLDIPPARLYKEFLVEKRMLISHSLWKNVSLYLENPRAFDQAIRELLHLCTKMTFLDLFGGEDHPFLHSPGLQPANSARYDNLPLAIVNGKGIITLIDLEDVAWTPQNNSVETLVKFFPLHADLLMEEARKLNLAFEETAIQTAKNEVLSFLQFITSNHTAWLEKQPDSVRKTPDTVFKLSEEQKEELTILVQDSVKRACITEINDVHNLSKTLIEATLSRLQKVIHQHHEDLKGSEEHALECRSPIIQLEKNKDFLQKSYLPKITPNLAQEFEQILKDNKKGSQDLRKTALPNTKELVISVLRHITNYLQNKGLIYYGDLRNYPNIEAHLLWIRY